MTVCLVFLVLPDLQVSPLVVSLADLDLLAKRGWADHQASLDVRETEETQDSPDLLE